MYPVFAKYALSDYCKCSLVQCSDQVALPGFYVSTGRCMERKFLPMQT